MKYMPQTRVDESQCAYGQTYTHWQLEKKTYTILSERERESENDRNVRGSDVK